MDTSFQNLKERFHSNSQKLYERKLKVTCVKNTLNEITDKSNCKLLALKKALKIKMDAKKKEKYEKRILMYKIANEEIDDYEKFFDQEEIGEEMNENEESEEEDFKNEEINEDNFENINEENIDKNYSDEESNVQDIVVDEIEENSNNNDDIENNQTVENDLEEKMELDSNCNEDKKIENLDAILNLNQSCLDNEELLGLCSAKIVDKNKSLIENEDNSTRLSFSKENDSSSQEISFSKKNIMYKESQESDNSNSLNFFKKKRENNFNEDSASEDELDFANKISKKFKINKIIEDDSEDEHETDSEEEFENNSQNNSPINDEENLSQKINSNFDNSKMFQTNTSSQFNANKPIHIKDFIDDQAELSEEDQDKVSSDEEDNSEDEYEQDDIQEDLPSDEQIYKQNNKVFLKQQIDEDKREILEYQERFLKFGDLQDNGDTRQRKFKWKNVDNVWLDNLKESSDSDEFDFDESEIGYTSLHLKNLEESNNLKKADLNENCDEETNEKDNSKNKDDKKLHNTSLNKSHLNIYSTFDDKLFNNHVKSLKRNFISGPKNDIQSYIIKDKSLVSAMSIKTSSSTKNKNRVETKPVNKKRKVDTKKPPKKSIFDLF